IQHTARIGYDVPGSINMLLSRLVLLRGAYHEALEKKRSFSRGMVYLLAARTVQEAECADLERIFFCDFLYLHKTEERVLRYFLDSGKAVFIRQGGEKWAESVSPGGFSLSLVKGFDAHSQVCAVREILRKPGISDNTVIVLPDPDKIIPLLSEIASFAGDFNVSMGYPLRRSAPYALFECIFKAQSTRKNGEYYAADYMRLVSHPLVKNLKLAGSNPAITRILVHKIEEVLIGVEKTSLGGSLFVRLRDIESFDEVFELAARTMQKMDIRVTVPELRDALSCLHGLLFSPWETVRNCGEFSRHLRILLDVLMEKSLLSAYPLNVKIIERMYAVQEDFDRVSFREEEFSGEDIFKIFRNKLDNEMFSFSGSPLKGLQILGMLETRALNFENVIIMDVNENTLPALKIRDPLIPREVMLRLGLNHLEKEEEIQRYQFRRLIASAKNVYLVYEESVQKEPSRFIEELLWERQKTEGKLDVLEAPRAVFEVQVISREKKALKKDEHVEFIRGMVYSPSSVDTYLDCPMKFYYQYLFGLREKENLLAGPEAAEIGTFIHGLLEAAFGIFKNKKPVLDDVFKKMFFDMLDEKFAREFEEKRRTDSFMLKKTVVFRMERFLDAESRRDVAEILELEREFAGMVQLGREYAFRARIDRIDLLGNGTVLVVDYKTGIAEVPRFTRALEEGAFSREMIRDSVRSFQLPLYLYFTDREYRGKRTNACLYAIRDVNRNAGLIKLFKTEEDIDNKERFMETYLRALEFILEEISAPDVPFIADRSNPRMCEYCPFSAACG
ncbi:MAG: PD-(D/E)XK nuclease family protein, partial [Candidatus Omnitrophica bacterium]|nr:PD-(D/E)XK nuclease family protein [Candidatus Omnitrophota bacterium]